MRNPTLSLLLSREKKAMRFLLHGRESWGIPHFLHSCLEERKRWGFCFMAEKAEEFPLSPLLSREKKAMRFLLHEEESWGIPTFPVLSKEKKAMRFLLHGRQSWGIPHFLHSCLEKRKRWGFCFMAKKAEESPLSQLLSREKKVMRFLLHGGESWGIPHFLHSCLQKRKRWGFCFMGEKAEESPLSPLLSREKKTMRFMLHRESWGIPHFLHFCLEKRKRWGFCFIEKAEESPTFSTLV